MNKPTEELIAYLRECDGINDKEALAKRVTAKFGLTKDRSVFYCQHYAIRFSASASTSFGNTVASLSHLQKFDDRPFYVCLVTKSRNHIFIANTTFLKKISHSSQELRENNIRGSFNGSDISRSFEGITNAPENFERLFNIHEGIGFEGNLQRLVEATNNISPSGRKFVPTERQRQLIIDAPSRARKFVASAEAVTLKSELDARVTRFKNEILLAALIENVNVRGRVIEYIIAGEDERLRAEIITALQDRSKGIPQFKTENALGDYSRVFADFLTETDVKTKIMVLDSNPKAYTLDKMLEFLGTDKSVFMFYFVGVDPGRIVDTVLVSMFQERLLKSTILLKHWAGRNSRGVSQFEGRAIAKIITGAEGGVDEEPGRQFLEHVLSI